MSVNFNKHMEMLVVPKPLNARHPFSTGVRAAVLRIKTKGPSPAATPQPHTSLRGTALWSGARTPHTKRLLQGGQRTPRRECTCTAVPRACSGHRPFLRNGVGCGAAGSDRYLEWAEQRPLPPPPPKMCPHPHPWVVGVWPCLGKGSLQM